MNHAFRSLLRTPGFTLIAILTLALGIGMNTAMFSMLNAFLLRPLVYPHAERLFRLDRSVAKQPFSDPTPAQFDDLAAASSGIADLAALRYWGFTLTGPDQPADMPFAARATANYFDVLGVKPELGRSFLPDEDAPGKCNVLVISHRYWETRFGSSPDIIGRIVRLDGIPTEIIGVLPANDDASRITGSISIYRPMAVTDGERLNRIEGNETVIGRYRDGVEPDQAAAQFDTIARRLVADHPAENAGLALRIRTLQSTTLTGVGRTLTFLLLGLSGFVLLIACGNLGNLLLARAISRARESSIRAALGATRAQLIKPLAVECLLLAITGGLAAIFLAMWTGDWLSRRLSDPSNPTPFSIDGRVLAFTFAISVVTALLFGVAPAWWAARARINESLKSGSRGTTGSRTQHRYRQLLIVTQFALALILLAGAGLFIRGLDRLVHTVSGWQSSTLITGSLNLASARYNTAEPILAFHRELRERLLALPGVANASVSFMEPLFNAPSQRSYFVAGREPPKPGHEAVAFTNGVSASYFDTVGTHLLRGRAFNQTDTPTSPRVVVINETMARALFPGENPIGRRLAVVGAASGATAEIDGVAEDVHSPDLRPSPIVFQVYIPFAQETWQYVTIAVRAADPAKVPALLEPIRRAVASLDPDQPVTNLRPAAERIQLNNSFLQTINQLLALFAGLGLLLAALGIYGVTMRLVAQRSAEIGLRMALGAQVRDILKLILGGGLRLTLTGACVGLAGAVFLSRYVASEMPGFGRMGILPVAVAAALLMGVALIACLLPARRATRVDPVVALRAE
ncbi:MAG TPA: ABC transporter permease [Lacunisphaera sp.]|nr:ABC transporter permease [Lacunisphaera sp.]